MNPWKGPEGGRFAGWFPVQPGCRRIVLRNDSVAPPRGRSDKLHHANRA
jgi:hypothetical protein